MGNNWKITDTLTKVFADEVPDGQGSIRLSTLHRETVSCVIAYFWGGRLGTLLEGFRKSAGKN